MAEQVGDAFVQLSVRDSQFNTKMDRAEGRSNSLGASFGNLGTAAFIASRRQGPLGAAAKSAGGSMAVATGKAAGFGVALRRVGVRTIGVAATVALAAGAVRKFAANEEAASKFSVVFGDNAESVGDEMDNFAGKVGRSSNELRSLTGDVGDVVKALGFQEDEAAELSVNLTQLAVDVASFKNASDDDVIRSFTRALTGERESLKTLGIVFEEADVAQELLSSGVQKIGGRFTKTQKALATYRLLLKNTTDSQGDAERTAGSLTNRMRFAGGSFKDASIEIGRMISQLLDLPAVFGAVGDSLKSFAGFLKEAFSPEFIIAFSENVKGALALMVNDIVSVFKSIGVIVDAAFDPDVDIFDALLENDRERQQIAAQIEADILSNTKKRLAEVVVAKKKQVDKVIEEEKRLLGFIGFEARAREATLQLAGAAGRPAAGVVGAEVAAAGNGAALVADRKAIAGAKDVERGALTANKKILSESQKQTKLAKQILDALKAKVPVII